MTDPSTTAPGRPERLPAERFYLVMTERAEKTIELIERRSAVLAWLRTFLFVVATVGLLLGYGADWYDRWCLLIGWSAAFGFLAAVIYHERLRQRRQECDAEIALFAHLRARTLRQWEQLPAVPILAEFEDVIYADDLDVGGRGSLLALLSLARTSMGNRCVQSWLFHPADWPMIQQRQRAVQRLAAMREMRIELLRQLAAHQKRNGSEYGLSAWASQPDWWSGRRWARAAAWLGPGLVLLGAMGLVWWSLGSRTTDAQWAISLVATGFAINMFATLAWGGPIHGIFQQVAGNHRAVERLVAIYATLQELPHDVPLLKEISEVAGHRADCALVGFRRLQRIVRLATLQRDPLLYFVYLALQLTIAWDFYILWWLERWKKQFGSAVPTWLDALGRCEALISAATLADENPAWCYAQPPSDANTAMHAENLAHPLLPDRGRVANTFNLDIHAPLMLVTGSNMAGKSTFLRAIGTNLLLARVGAPSCASQLCTENFELATSIRLRDSLQDGISFFMAELRRIKRIVEMAEKAQMARHDDPSVPRILFLLDEILQGTNSRERLLAVRKIIMRLLQAEAVGFISTHDLDLAACEEIQRVAQVVHFREYFVRHGDEEVMQFDYRLRPGPTPTTNALKLLQLVGLDDDATTSEAPS